MSLHRDSRCESEIRAHLEQLDIGRVPRTALISAGVTGEIDLRGLSEKP
jgi:hypothetical protein